MTAWDRINDALAAVLAWADWVIGDDGAH